MGKFNTLCRGTIEEVMRILDEDKCDEQELRAALGNAFGRLQVLERQLEKLQKRIDER